VTLRFCTDTSAADWLVHTRTPPFQLITFGPAGYAAYARLRFIPDPTRPGQAETDAGITAEWPSEISQARRALLQLMDFTAAPDDCYFCLWDGYSGTFQTPELTRGPLVSIPYRRYALFSGPLADIQTWEQDFGGGLPCPPPAFVWPADHRWCFASDVDPHWAGIGAEPAAIDRLVDDPDIDVVRAEPDVPAPAYR